MKFDLMVELFNYVPLMEVLQSPALFIIVVLTIIDVMLWVLVFPDVYVRVVSILRVFPRILFFVWTVLAMNDLAEVGGYLEVEGWKLWFRWRSFSVSCLDGSVSDNL